MAESSRPGRPTVAALRARITELEAANAELTTRLDAALEAEPTARLDTAILDPSAASARRPARWRGPVAAVLIVLGALLTPVSIASGWARAALTDPDAFVATYAPLVDDPRVQAYITDEIVAAIDARLDIDATVGDIVSGLSQGIQRPGLQTALQMLQQPAAEGIRSTIRGVAARLVASDAFAQVWRESLRLSHVQATGALSGDPGSVATITDDGLGLRLAPLIAAVKGALVDQGFALASRIPSVDRTIVVVPSSSLVQAQLGYRLVLATGYWLGILVLVLLVAGVLISVRRWLAAIWAAVGLGLGAAVVLGAVGITRVIAQTAVPASVMPNDVLLVLFDTTTQAIDDLAVASVLLAIVVAVSAWLAAPFRVSTAIRRAWEDVRGALRSRAEARGLSSGSVGEWLYAQRVVLRILVAVLAAVVLVFNRPLSAGVVIGTTAAGVAALLVLSLLQRSPVSAPPPQLPQPA